MSNIRWFNTLSMKDLELVGGKNASLGELIQNLAGAGVKVPNGFATTADAFWTFLETQQANEISLAKRINERMAGLNVDDVHALAAAGQDIRGWILEADLPDALEAEIRKAYSLLEQEAGAGLSVAVRSSATAEDLPEASFAGQQDTYLNVQGIEDVIAKVKQVFASLYTDRAIAYRVHHGFEHSEVALSAGIQRMVRSDVGASGVAFSLDTESGFDGAVFITATVGLGELLVQGAINPDEYYLGKVGLKAGKPALLSKRLGSKLEKMIYSDDAELVKIIETPLEEQQTFALTDDELTLLGNYILSIEEHYGRPMDIEWGKDGLDGQLYILQARPETVQSRASEGQVLERFHMHEAGNILVIGRSVGQRIGSGTVRIVRSASEMDKVQEGDVLVADMTDPDWEPVMKRASAIVTNRGGRTCHAAIIARELQIPAVVGCGDATSLLQDGMQVTVSCAEGDSGFVYEGELDFELQKIALDSMPDIPVKIMMNVASPERAFSFSKLPNAGVGLARVEFIINNVIGIHPRALLDYPNVSEAVKSEIQRRTAGYESPKAFFKDKLAEGVATIAAAFYPKAVIVRLSDFKSNEYAHLVGGTDYEPVEENPMIGFRGASRYVSTDFAEAFALECEAMRFVRDDMGLDNIQLMVPFVRTVGQARAVIEKLAQHGLKRGENDLKLIMMCEVPSNAILANDFLEYFDGFSIGSNDLTQFTLALDRDSGLVADLFDEQDPAVKAMMSQAIKACLSQGKYIGICGQGPSDHPELATWLMEQGIESISLNPDTVLDTWLHLAKSEAKTEVESEVNTEVAKS